MNIVEIGLYVKFQYDNSYVGRVSMSGLARKKTSLRIHLPYILTTGAILPCRYRFEHFLGVAVYSVFSLSSTVIVCSGTSSTSLAGLFYFLAFLNLVSFIFNFISALMLTPNPVLPDYIL